MKPQNFEERVVWIGTTWTYPAFFIGFQPFLAPIIGWGLGLYAIYKLWTQPVDSPTEDKIRVPIGIWVWAGGLLLLELALIAGHVDFEMPNRILTSTVSIFFKAWCLFALLPLAGSCLKIRPQLVARAVCILCIQSLILTILCKAGITVPLYTTPFGSVGGVTEVMLINNDGGENRVGLFTPWPPALGLVGAVFLPVAYLDPNWKWRWSGVIGTFVIMWASGSRTAQICAVAIPALVTLLSHLSRPSAQIATGLGGFLAGLFGAQVYAFFRDLGQSINDERSGSSLLRRTVFNVSIYRWRTEAFWWGHGRSTEGPAVTRNEFLGSHNTWSGLLYSHGLMGLIAVTIPLVWSAIEFLVKSQISKVAQASLGILIALLIYTVSENINFLVYLYWPALIVMGLAFKEKWPSLDWLIEPEVAEAKPESLIGSTDKA